MCRRNEIARRLQGWVLVAGFAWMGSARAGVSIDLVSRAYTNAPVFFGDSLGVELSADGAWALITSSADTIVRTGQDEASQDVFLRNNVTGDVKLISRSLSGGGGDGPSIGLALSADGRYALFESDADDLTTNDTNSATDIFLYDAVADTLTMVSQRGGVPADADSTDATMTPDGRFVLFQSAATNLAEEDTNGVADLFLFDRMDGSLKWVTKGFSGGERRPRFDVSLSADGRYVGFLSAATNVVGELLHPAGQDVPAGSDPQVYVRDMLTGTVYWKSEQIDLLPGRFGSHVRLSTNGMVAFISSDLTAGASSVAPSTFIYFSPINVLNFTHIPSPLDASVNAPKSIADLAISPDARFIAYILNYGSPLGGPGYWNVYLYDALSQTNRLLASSTNTFNAAGGFANITVSNDGRVVSFTGLSTALSSPDNGISQLYSFDTQENALRLLSKNSAGEIANDSSSDAVLSADGSAVAFVSAASNLSSSNSLPADNVFLVASDGSKPPSILSGEWPTATSSTGPGGSTLVADPFREYLTRVNLISMDGSRIVFASSAPNLVPKDVDGHADFFWRDLTKETTTLIPTADGNNLTIVGLSADGEKLAYFDHAGISPNHLQLHLFDLKTGQDLLPGLLPDALNPAVPAWGTIAALSNDGKWLLFDKRTNDFGEAPHFRVIDVGTGESITLPPIHSPQLTCVFSRSGRYVIFQSQTSAPSLVIDWRSGVTNNVGKTYIGSTADDNGFLFKTGYGFADPGDLFLFSPAQNSSNILATNVSYPAMSGDGSFVFFNQIGTNDSEQAVALDRLSSKTVSLGNRVDGVPIRFDEEPAVSPDGRYVAFSMRRYDGGPTDDYLDVYRYDRILRKVVLVSQTSAGSFPDLPSRAPSIAADGKVAFESMASDLVANDRNLDSDVFVATIAATDADQNGLEDGWEIQYFGSIGANPAEDADGDGMSNLAEWRAGTDPTDPASVLKLSASVEGSSAKLQWKGVAGKRYIVQTSGDIKSGEWEIASEIVATSSQAELQVVLAANRGFYRLLVE